VNQLLLHDSPLSSLWVYPERKIVHHFKKTYCYGADLRESLTKGVDAMVRHRATKWLSDNRASSVVPKDDEAWAGTVWFPRVRAAGWTHWAIVQSATLIGQINTKRHAQSLNDMGIHASMFSDPDEALRWLDEA
jgi:hypothetical protein